MSDLLKNLNVAQNQAVKTTQGPVLVLAGAGTGKTRVLIHRLAYILEQRLAHPWECLCMTFTNKAAEEMRDRLTPLVGEEAHNVWLGTFHRIGLKLIRPHLDLLGLKAPFSIFDEDDSKLVLKKIMQDMGIDIKANAPVTAVEKISRLKDRGVSPEDIKELKNDFAEGRLLPIYKRYQERLKELNAVDFGDLILLPLQLIEKNEAIAQKMAFKFKYVLVDEYQDTNTAQYRLLKKLAAGSGNICCVGDDDQSIYAWRGADIRNILDFQKDFPKATLIRLEENYRSTPMILKTASHLIANNKERLGKTLRPGKEHDSQEKVKIHSFFDADEEARFIAQTLYETNQKGTSWSQMAVLIRSGYLSRAIEEQLIENEIPYKTVGTIKFYDRAEIKDALCYMRLIVHPQDDLAFERIINTPRRGVGSVALTLLQEGAKIHKKSLFEALKIALDFGKIKGKTGEALKEFVSMIEGFQQRAVTDDCGKLGEEILIQSGYMAHWENSKEPDASLRLEHLKDLLITMGRYGSLPEFLEHIALISAVENLNGEEHVLLMTMHAAKGLEFDLVCLPAWEEKVFPNDKALEEGSLEEERRLAYVGITRAKKQAMISYVASRFVFGARQHNFPSSFINELPVETTDIIDHSIGAQPTVKKAKKIAQDFSFAQDLNSLLVGRKVNHKTFGVGEILDADASTLTVVFENNHVEKLHARYVEFL
ncbi:MAG: UvrD-helicase domain-containing protein [Alphaproteobacteria bacterium]|nr:UvrD-helicase domain-containing protein [Alphaproteobacteria bacterium]MBN2780131.1 UvrD-helicase domain-containing protein [Alphaproteobacteria bacterium]